MHLLNETQEQTALEPLSYSLVHGFSIKDSVHFQILLLASSIHQHLHHHQTGSNRRTLKVRKQLRNIWDRGCHPTFTKTLETSCSDHCKQPEHCLLEIEALGSLGLAMLHQFKK